MNPFDKMRSEEELLKMNLEALLEAQREVLFPEEQEKFDREESIYLKPGDKREEYLDFIDRLICDIHIAELDQNPHVG